MLLQTLLFTVLFTNIVLSIPPNDKSLFDDDNPEARGHKRRRPCRGRSPDGRTFFDWNLHYVDVNYNYNYNINCGGGGGGQHDGGGGGFQKPILNGIGSGGGGGGGGGPQKPILNGILQGVGNAISGDDAGGGGGGGLLSSGINFVQNQVQNVLANPPNLASYFPQDSSNGGGGLGGLFNGQGVLSLFENGLFSGIFDNRPANPSQNPPPRPPPSVPNRPPPSVPIRPPPSVPNRPPPVAVQTTPDPDDIIYNDEKPVHEPHDDVFPDQYNRPGQYIVASNPHFGTYVHQVSGYNRNRMVKEFRRGVKQFNKELNWLADSFASLFEF